MNPKVARAVALGLTEAGIGAARALARKHLPQFPHNGCAAFLSALLTDAGLADLRFEVGAQELADELEARGWQRVAAGRAMPGDVGVTKDLGGKPGADHIFLILEVLLDRDTCRIADNQSERPHFRHLSGHGKTPVAYLLRAPE